MRERPILYTGAMVRAYLADQKGQTRRMLKPARDSVWGCHMAPHEIAGEVNGGEYRNSKYGAPGDSLWVRENWRWLGGVLDCSGPARKPEDTVYSELLCSYPADGGKLTIKPGGWVATPEAPPPRAGEVYSLRDAPADFAYDGNNTYMDRLHKWWERTIPAIHMYRWASRLTQTITGIRAEKLSQISRADALAEGIVETHGGYGLPDGSHFHAADPRESYWSLFEAINGPGSVQADPWLWVIEFPRFTEA